MNRKLSIVVMACAVLGTTPVPGETHKTARAPVCRAAYSLSMQTMNSAMGLVLGEHLDIEDPGLDATCADYLMSFLLTLSGLLAIAGYGIPLAQRIKKAGFTQAPGVEDAHDTIPEDAPVGRRGHLPTVHVRKSGRYTLVKHPLGILGREQWGVYFCLCGRAYKTVAMVDAQGVSVDNIYIDNDATEPVPSKMLASRKALHRKAIERLIQEIRE